MKFIPTALPGVIVIEPDVFKDQRGFFLESFQENKYREGGIPGPFVQDNHSRSVKGTLRGLHAQLKHPQGKLVRVVEGEVFDVAVDVRPASPTFKQWAGVTLSAENFKQFYLPPGCLHGFCVLSETAQFEYKCTDFYDADDEIAVLWNDPAFGIDWPIETPVLSERDKAARLWDEVVSCFM